MMKSRSFEVSTASKPSLEVLTEAVLRIFGLASAQLAFEPKGDAIEPVVAWRDPAYGGSYVESLCVVVSDPIIAVGVRHDIDLGVPLARIINDEVVCTPAGVPGVDDNALYEPIWAVIDPQGVVRLAREIDTGDDDDFKDAHPALAAQDHCQATTSVSGKSVASHVTFGRARRKAHRTIALDNAPRFLCHSVTGGKPGGDGHGKQLGIR
jgi:hypothetical protein